tara:strand:- start:216 stop:545 length:330 start_codon:yes stop_codon:yes gene_type:complete
MAMSIAVVNILGELFIITTFAINNLNISFLDTLTKGLIPGLLPGIIASLYWFVISLSFEVLSYIELVLLVLPGIFILTVCIYFCSLKEDKQKMMSIVDVVKEKINNREV